MRLELIVRFGGRPDITLHAEQPLPLDEARAWLDSEYQRLECMPTRASGKVLSADKLLAVAQAVGEPGFADAAWAAHYLRAAAGVLGKTLVRVDVDGQSVGY